MSRFQKFDNVYQEAIKTIEHFRHLEHAVNADLADFTIRNIDHGHAQRGVTGCPQYNDIARSDGSTGGVGPGEGFTRLFVVICHEFFLVMITGRDFCNRHDSQ